MAARRNQRQFPFSARSPGGSQKRGCITRPTSAFCARSSAFQKTARQAESSSRPGGAMGLNGGRAQINSSCPRPQPQVAAVALSSASAESCAPAPAPAPAAAVSRRPLSSTTSRDSSQQRNSCADAPSSFCSSAASASSNSLMDSLSPSQHLALAVGSEASLDEHHWCGPTRLGGVAAGTICFILYYLRAVEPCKSRASARK